MNLYGVTPGLGSSSPSYLMPKLNYATQQANPLTATQAYNVTVAPNAVPQDDNLFTGAAKYLAASPVNTIDTMAALFPGVAKGSINDAVYNAVGMPQAADWVRKNQQGVDLTSGVLGAFGIGILSDLALARMGESAWLASTGLGRAVSPLTQWVGKAEAAAKTASLEAAASGESLSWLSGANLGLLTAKTTTGALKAGVSEIAIATALQKNKAIWSEDMATNLMFAGLGVGIGAAIGAVSARGLVYRWANSEEVQNTLAHVADPSGYERMGAEMPTSGQVAGARTTPKETSVATSMMLNARNAEATQTATRRDIQLGTEAKAREIVGRVTRRGLPEQKDTGFGMFSRSGENLSPEGRHISEALHDDPTILYGADALTKADDIEVKLASRKTWIDFQRDPLNKEAKPVLADRLEKQTPLVMVDKSLWPVKEAKEFLEARPDQIVFKPTAAGTQELTWEAPSGGRFVMREDGGINKPFDQLTVPDLAAVGEAGNKIMANMLRRNEPVVVPAKPDFWHLDFASEYQNRGGQVVWEKSGLSGPDAAKVESLRQKAVRLEKVPEITASVRYRLNLPQATSAERISDPHSDLLRGMVSAAKVSGASTQDLKNLRMQMQKMTELNMDAKTLDNLDGNFYKFNRSQDSGSWMPPVMGFYDDVPAAKWSKFELADQVQENKVATIQVMKGKKNAVLVPALTNELINQPEMRVAMDVSGLGNAQLPGTSHVVGATASQFLTQGQRFRFTPALQAAQQLRRVFNRGTENYVNQVLTRLKPFVDQFAGVANQNSRILFNQYLSNSAGWEIEKAIQGADGMTTFQLVKESPSNIRRLGRPIKEGEVMTNPRTGNPIALDVAGEKARKAFEGEMRLLLNERNALREARGLSPIRAKDFFTPPPSTKGKIVGFTLDAANRPVIGGAIVAQTESDFANQLAQLNKELKPGQRFMRQEEIRAHADLWDQAQLDFIDPTQFANRPAHQSGALFSASVNPRGLDDAIDYLKKGYEQVSNGVMRNVFESQLSIAQIRHVAEGNSRGISSGTRDIWEEYERTLMGHSPSASDKGITGLFHQIDAKADSMIAAAWPTMTGAVSSLHLRDVMDKIGVKDVGNVRSFQELADKLGPHMPFKDAMDYAAYAHKVVPPPELKQVSRFLNRIGAAVVLRWLEFPQAVMNMTGIVTNMPGLLIAKNVPTIGRVKGVSVIDSYKILAKGFGRMTHERSAGDWEHMVNWGDATQDAMDVHSQMSLMNSRAGWQKVVLGDPSAKGLKKLGIEGVASYMTDTSENLSRIWAHFTGLELADHHGIVGMDARHNFARQIANDAIANYDPLNRPEIFSSAFGNSYGLFLSYAQNYYQRLFRYVEDGDFRAIGHSLGMQASMFGLTGLPGSRQLMAMMGGEDDGTSALDTIYNTYGPVVGSTVANGGLNQLVTLFGLPAVALHTRGDINFRHPTLDFMMSGQVVLPIGLEAIKDVSTGLFGVMGDLVNPNVPHSTQHMAEVMARTMPNRALRGTLSVLAAGGKESDANGNMMSENKDLAESIYRMVGLRSARQQSNIEAYYTNQKALAIDSQRMAGVRETTRSIIRSGNLDSLPQVFEKYVQAGGKPWNYPSWIRGMIRDADNVKAANQLDKALRSPGQQLLARRIQMFTGDYDF